MIKLNKHIFKILVFSLCFFTVLILYYLYFSDIYLSNSINFIIFNNSILFTPTTTVSLNDLKLLSIVLFILSDIITSNIISTKLTKLIPTNSKTKKQKSDATSDSLELYIGNSEANDLIKIPESGLYQNFLITGSIGSGKTSSAMYPFTKQLIEYSNSDITKKLGLLILDVKGNYYLKVKEFAQNCGRQNDIIVIEPNGPYTYNPLDKPNLKPSVIANQLKTILLLFSPNNSEAYWLDKAETALCEAIKLCRMYNDNYVTFVEIHKLITDINYYHEKIKLLHSRFLDNKLSKVEIYDLLSAIKFFEQEFFALDLRTLNILKSEITRITNFFVSDYEISKTFCPPKENLSFKGFYDVIQSGKIVVLNMNISKYKNLSKIISAYLKLDFQTEVMSRLASDSYSDRPVAFISDEYSEYVTLTDSNFFSQSREAKCINIISTQSYTSLLNALNNKYSVEVIIQNLVNKIWFRSDDIYTIESAQKQFGKKDRTHISHTFSENAKQTNYNFITHSLNSKDSNISESINTSTQFDYIYDSNFFTKTLKTFSSLCFLTDGNKITYTGLINMLPYFK